METEEITKLVDGIYKNILDKFNPGARQMINAGKAYLKALHGAAAASRMYVDAITKLARQSQQGTWGGSSDIGASLMQIVEVYKEIQSQQMNILKAFYVDLLVPLETNLEKDTKVVQSEQKRFLQQHKQRSETYSKAAATIKKHRKKHKNSSKIGIASDKELKSMQILEEERSKLDAFCEQSLKNAMTQERRRYGFVLERQCSLAKHYLAYHTVGHTLYQNHLDDWHEVAKSRETLPSSVENMFANKLSSVSFWADDGGSPKMDDDRASVASQLRKTKSMDASCLDMRAMNDISSPPHHPLARAKSDFNLTASTQSLTQEIAVNTTGRRPKSLAVGEPSNWDTPLARAMYAYLSSGENQLSFLEGDVIALMGERNKGWQFGENLRTQCTGWFPLAYTEPFIDDSATSASSPTHKRGDEVVMSPSGGPVNSPSAGNIPRPAPLTRFGDTLALRHHTQVSGQVGGGIASGFSGGPPETPAPGIPRGKLAPPNNLPPAPRLPRPPPASASLHSSNDSGFSNDPPPAPEIDYSDDEPSRTIVEKKELKKMHGDDRSKSRSRSQATSVRGWLGNSVDEWYAGSTVSKRAVRNSSSAGHISTMGRSGEVCNKLEEVQRQLRELEMPYDKKVKRTKSLWKFRRAGDEVVEGMSMWRHRSLIDINVDEKGREQTPKPGKKSLSLLSSHTEDTGTLKGPPNHSDLSDSESCIVVHDHRKRTDPTILPRTRLIKKRDSITLTATQELSVSSPPSWYNSWDDINN